MSFCSKCGKQHKKGESFCSQCGTALKEVKDVIEKTIKVVERKSSKGFVVFIILLIVVGYVALDIWAMTQLSPDLSIGSLFNSISNAKFDDGGVMNLATSVITGNYFGAVVDAIGAAKKGATLSTTIRIKNPTFVPVIAGRVVYDANYGGTKFLNGKTGWILIMPYSERDIPTETHLSYVGGGWSLLKAGWDKLTGREESLNANAYMDIGITKFRIAGAGQ